MSKEKPNIIFILTDDQRADTALIHDARARRERDAGVGEELFYADHLFNAHLEKIFCYMRTNAYAQLDAKDDTKLL